MSAGPFTLTAPMCAVLSDDRRHRYWLTRIWSRVLPVLVVCMFNPSTANERDDDPTISRLCDFARRWGYGGVLVINLHSLRSSDPAIIQAMETGTRGDAQDAAWRHAIELASAQLTPILVAWGNLASEADARPFLDACRDVGLELVCLGRTKSGAPTHPMARGRSRVPDDQAPESWAP